MKKLMLAMTIAALTTGCATVEKQSITSTASGSLKDQTVVQTARPVPAFAAMTAGKAAFAMLGGVAMIAAGNDLVKTNAVPDPSVAISAALLQHLQAARGVRAVAPAVMVDSSSPEQIAAAGSGKAKYILDVQTVGWGFSYFPMDWSHYRVVYSANARLIDTTTRQVVAQGTCKRAPESNTNAPTHDTLVANQAAGLKQELQIAADECIKTLKAEMLVL